MCIRDRGYIHFLTMHKYMLQTIEDHYIQKGASLGPDQEIGFQLNRISLDIPEDGICVGNVWNIIPLTVPIVRTKVKVDSDRGRK